MIVCVARELCRFRFLVGVASVVLFALVFSSSQFVLAATVIQHVETVLNSQNAYVSQSTIKAGKAQAGDVQRLEQEATAEANRGVPTKIAIFSQLPVNSAGVRMPPPLAARVIRRFLDFHGNLILVTPPGIYIAISSDKLSSAQEHDVALRAERQCHLAPVNCAIAASRNAADTYKSIVNNDNRNAAIFWLVVLLVIGGIIGLFVRRARKKQGISRARRDDLRTAASNTLSLADEAVTKIEASAGQMQPQVRAEYDRALGLRDRARAELDRANTPAALTQTNQDAAQAVLALQGVMRSLGIENPLANTMDLPGHRCFYCGRDDRPPYTPRTIDDGKGNSLQIEVCAVDLQQLERGRTPQIATVQQGGTPMPWWAQPGNPYYYSYGGPTWQYWLPFWIGMDVGGWYGGGWYNYGPGYGDVGGYGYGDGGYGDGSSGGYGNGGQTPSDSGGADFGSGNGSGGGGDSGGWSGGGDSSGGWGGGGDSTGGGGDSGGADFGGGDWGGGGDSGGDGGGGDGGGGDGGGGW